LLDAGDEISSPDGDPYETYRILFDLTFFFFVIVILLAIIQGESRLFFVPVPVSVFPMRCDVRSIFDDMQTFYFLQ